MPFLYHANCLCGAVTFSVTGFALTHIYTDFKANWYAITDDLPQYGEGRDGD